ncbi:MAG TPA: hypothetical protein VHK67_05845 [Rhabdochlamydiaceae bacterium]|jgi:hypothetical protein|nr:hypothetical protein [Rhabdochlamydiaceae bacterium]
MSTGSVFNSSIGLPIEVVDKVFGFLEYDVLFWNVSVVCKEWRARPLVQDVISIYMKETQACLNAGYPLDLINSLLKHSIVIGRLPALPVVVGYPGTHYRDFIHIKDMVNPLTKKPTSLMRFKQPDHREFGLVMRIKCFALIKFKELVSIKSSDFHSLLDREALRCYPKRIAFETGMSPPDSVDDHSERLLFLTVCEGSTSTTVSTNHWSDDDNAFMNYAYKLKGIDKQITREKSLSQCMEEMLIGDGLFQIYSPPDQISPPPITT